MIWNSSFWGQSFVAELTRISAQGEKKLKLRRASLVKPLAPLSEPKEPEPELKSEHGVEVDGDNGLKEANGDLGEEDRAKVETKSQTL